MDFEKVFDRRDMPWMGMIHGSSWVQSGHFRSALHVRHELLLFSPPNFNVVRRMVVHIDMACPGQI